MIAPAPLARLVVRIKAQRGGDSMVLIGTTLVSNLVRIASTMAMTRLLAPDIFGLVGIINTIFFIVTMLTDLGFQAYVVRHPDGDDRRFLRVIWTIHAGRGAGLALISAALAFPLAQLLAKPELALPLAVASTIFLINGLASLSLITALRTHQVAKLCYLDLGVLIFQTLVAMTSAALLHNVWSIIIAMAASAALRTILSYSLFPNSCSGIAIDRAVSKDFWRFSRFVMGSSLLTLLIAQTDKIVLARVLSLDRFGLYMIATTLAGVPLVFAGNYASRILYPRYASMFRDTSDRLPQIYYAGRRTLSLIYNFSVGGLIGGAPILIRVLYDDRYVEASPYLSLLATASLMALGNRAANEVLTAMGHVQVTFTANVFRLTWLIVVGVPAYLGFGPLGLVTAIGLIEAPPHLYNWWQLHRFGIFNAREEGILIGAAVLGMGIGFVMTALLSFLW
ncbi:oligosaccharide flippase family protein [Sphingomonas sp. YR710]|uniref:oligosaccharide flippase family protein n=1 Tax=Sphingomonas sp. YR710 TaxID=1882773 RepID=UPI0015A09505|nr:oligosaccharide flippase family protein [Sphingomonas sp. YR710]